MELTLKELHEKYLSMMVQFHRCCEEHHLTYYVDGGTLLGTIRHRGFIIWDDDVDIAMPRPDYESLLRNAKKWLPDTLYLDNHRWNKDCIFPYSKMINRGLPIALINDPDIIEKAEIIVHFDLYPIDGIGDDLEASRRLYWCVNRIKAFLAYNVERDRMSTNPIKRLLKRIIQLIPTNWLVQRIDNKMVSFEYIKSSYVTRWRGEDALSNIFIKDIFGEPVLLPFENSSFYVPKAYDAYLSMVYGDYMVLPPNEERNVLRHSVTTSPSSRRYSVSIRKVMDE